MGTFFLDTSALVKRYVAEKGQMWVTNLYQPTAGHIFMISQATLAEAVAAFCRKARAQAISEAERDQVIALFRQDVRRRYRIERVTTALYTHAGDLCRVHTLRAYDAIQLACALSAADKLTAIGAAPPIFVSADADLLAMAAAEGLATENPESYA
jgi:predicted nucleic acid-binding protein